MAPQDIIQFWFGGLTDVDHIHKNHPIAKRWFNSTPEFDQEIRSKFESAIETAKRGECKEWEKAPEGMLALILLFDQFTRNIYRGKPETYSCDKLALDLSRRAFQDEMDRDLELIERLFLYMPFMHSENLQDQEQAVMLFEGLAVEVAIKSPQNLDYFKYNLSFAHQYRGLIKKFGRFPHRNKILGRTSTSEEQAILKA